MDAPSAGKDTSGRGGKSKEIGPAEDRGAAFSPHTEADGSGVGQPSRETLASLSHVEIPAFHRRGQEAQGGATLLEEEEALQHEDGEDNPLEEEEPQLLGDTCAIAYAGQRMVTPLRVILAHRHFPSDFRFWEADTRTLDEWLFLDGYRSHCLRELRHPVLFFYFVAVMLTCPSPLSLHGGNDADETCSTSSEGAPSEGGQLAEDAGSIADVLNDGQQEDGNEGALEDGDDDFYWSEEADAALAKLEMLLDKGRGFFFPPTQDGGSNSVLDELDHEHGPSGRNDEYRSTRTSNQVSRLPSSKSPIGQAGGGIFAYCRTSRESSSSSVGKLIHRMGSQVSSRVSRLSSRLSQFSAGMRSSTASKSSVFRSSSALLEEEVVEGHPQETPFASRGPRWSSATSSDPLTTENEQQARFSKQNNSDEKLGTCCSSSSHGCGDAGETLRGGQSEQPFKLCESELCEIGRMFLLVEILRHSFRDQIDFPCDSSGGAEYVDAMVTPPRRLRYRPNRKADFILHRRSSPSSTSRPVLAAPGDAQTRRFRKRFYNNFYCSKQPDWRPVFLHHYVFGGDEIASIFSPANPLCNRMNDKAALSCTIEQEVKDYSKIEAGEHDGVREDVSEIHHGNSSSRSSTDCSTVAVGVTAGGSGCTNAVGSPASGFVASSSTELQSTSNRAQRLAYPVFFPDVEPLRKALLWRYLTAERVLSLDAFPFASLASSFRMAQINLRFRVPRDPFACDESLLTESADFDGPRPLGIVGRVLGVSPDWWLDDISVLLASDGSSETESQLESSAATAKCSKWDFVAILTGIPRFRREFYGTDLVDPHLAAIFHVIAGDGRPPPTGTASKSTVGNADNAEADDAASLHDRDNADHASSSLLHEVTRPKDDHEGGHSGLHEVTSPKDDDGAKELRQILAEYTDLDLPNSSTSCSTGKETFSEKFTTHTLHRLVGAAGEETGHVARKLRTRVRRMIFLRHHHMALGSPTILNADFSSLLAHGRYQDCRLLLELTSGPE
ncbi:unnamed protein product [Amoebophrya sp. A25]|nr:unnamed protein product [Amoebophrya sp. A25]|eukprot:GSA25T00008845001.1